MPFKMKKNKVELTQGKTRMGWRKKFTSTPRLRGNIWLYLCAWTLSNTHSRQGEDQVMESFHVNTDLTHNHLHQDEKETWRGMARFHH